MADLTRRLTHIQIEGRADAGTAARESVDVEHAECHAARATAAAITAKRHPPPRVPGHDGGRESGHYRGRLALVGNVTSG